MAQHYSNFQRSGSEYGGVAHTPSGVQPKPSEAFTNTERLRLGYTTGEEEDWKSIEDTRQMVGLRPANGGRPLYIDDASPEDDPRLRARYHDAIDVYEHGSISMREWQEQQSADNTWDDEV